jgi:hypothetical protein
MLVSTDPWVHRTGDVMDDARGASHLRYALRSLLWAATSLACLLIAQSGLEQYAGIPQRPDAWWFAAVVLIPLAHTGWVSRATVGRESGAEIGRSCAIGVGGCSLVTGTSALLGSEPLSAAWGVLQNAALAAGAILLPRFALLPLAPGVFAEEASIEGYRGHRVRQLLAHAAVGMGIAGMLLAIAVPKFMVFGLLAKAGETRFQIQAIRDAQERWHSEHGHYLPVTPYPAGPPGVHKSEFDYEAYARSGLDRLGWPELTALYCRYAVTVGEDERVGAYTIEAVCDLDGDGEPMAFGWVKPAPGERTGVPGPFGFCSVRGVLSRRGAKDGLRLLDQYGPCDAVSAVSDF